MIAVSPLIENVFAPLDKIVLMPLGVSAAMSETDVSIQKKISESSTTTLIIPNE